MKNCNMTLADIPQHLTQEIIAKYGSHSERKSNYMNVIQRASVVSQIKKVTDSESQPVLNANGKRAFLIIQNNGSSDVFINFGNKADTNNLKIIAGGNYEPVVIPVNSVYLVSGAGLENQCAIVEGVEVN